MAKPFTAKEGTTAIYKAKIVDENQVAIPAASLSTLTLTLYEVIDGLIINSRDDQNVLNANGVTVDASGNLTWTAAPADNAIVSTNGYDKEDHVGLFEFTWSAGTKAGKHEVKITVTNLAKVP